jgi:hypothetical protein
MLKNKTMAYAVFSIVIPLAAYSAFFFMDGPVPSPLSGARRYALLPVFNIIGIIFSLIALSRSNEKPVNTSPGIRIAVLLGTLGMLANTIALEMILSRIILR